MIDFNEIAVTDMPEFKGGKGVTSARMHVDELGKIMKVTLKQGSSIGLHTHETNSEIIYILEGTASCLLNGEMETVTSGQCHYCPKGSSHSVMNENPEDLVMFCVVPEQ